MACRRPHLRYNRSVLIRSGPPTLFPFVRGLYHHFLNVGSGHPPQTQGKVQSAVNLALSGMNRLQTEALIGLVERQTTSKVPDGLT